MALGKHSRRIGLRPKTSAKIACKRFFFSLRPTPLFCEKDSRVELGRLLLTLSLRGTMANLKGLASIVAELRVERTNLVNQLKHLDAALTVLGKLNGGSSYTKPRGTLSASARKRISLAQKSRWANRSANVPGQTAKPKRTMSASARRKIAAFQRTRWAKLKKAA